MNVITDPQKIDHLLTRHVVEAVDAASLRRKLESGKPLRIKLGADPNRPDLHLGHAVVMKKLRDFQELGHTVVLLIGDYTSTIGDPSGKSKTRPVLTLEEVKVNAKTYADQAAKILDMSKVELRFNSEWFSKMSFLDVLELAAKFTVARLIERDDFDKRLKGGIEIHLHELMYPMMQAYDSIALDADVEIGGTDQRFNILAGRELQSKLGKPQQDCMFLGPVMVGTDGVHKMSKSLDNYIGLNDSADQMFGKTMSIPDSALWDWFTLATDLTDDEISEMRRACETGEMNPRDAKARLAKAIITEYHDAAAADAAEQNFIDLFQKKEIPDEMPEMKVEEGSGLLKVMVDAKLVTSNGEARRQIEQGGVRLDEQTITDPSTVVAFGDKPSLVLQKGKRHFVRLMRV